jgi:hypothetical protein
LTAELPLFIFETTRERGATLSLSPGALLNQEAEGGIFSLTPVIKSLKFTMNSHVPWGMFRSTCFSNGKLEIIDTEERNLSWILRQTKIATGTMIAEKVGLEGSEFIANSQRITPSPFSSKEKGLRKNFLNTNILIRSIQRTEGNPDCSRKAEGYCDRLDFAWCRYCLGGDRAPRREDLMHVR